MRKTLILIFIIAISCKPAQVAPSDAANKLGQNPYFEIDGETVNGSDLNKYNANKMALVTTYYGKDATDQYGSKAKDGAVIIETKDYARMKYQSFFSKVSSEYEEIVNEYDEKNEIQYILNGKILTDNYEGDLSTITKKRLKSIDIISKEYLIQKFSITNKQVGVIIKAKPPKNLYKGEEKF